ncbi:MAG: dihydroorotate dehydrogenase electron transfer subunit [Candidatus Diapherotrites archaeon]|nr:dihydroorotate dehydrogenase electron transfer subunit [Candidatus Diapherotrites archaeon]
MSEFVQETSTIFSRPKVVKVLKVEDHGLDTKTIFLDLEVDAKPGQFVMIWLPGIDEKPFTLDFCGKGKKTAITLQAKGFYTKKLIQAKQGDLIGIRGPYGTNFPLQNSQGKKFQNACIVGGGLGIPALTELSEALAKQGTKFTAIIGGRTKQSVLSEERFAKFGKVFPCTDDGSHGFKGFTTDKMKELIQSGEKFDVVYSCGPEIMMNKALNLAIENKAEYFGSLERFMKCGIGICSACCVNEYRVCTDGPVFSGQQLKQMEEFGQTARLKTGKKIELKEYVSIKDSGEDLIGK